MNMTKSLLKGVVILGAIGIMSAQAEGATFAQEQTELYLQTACTAATYPNDSSDNHEWSIKQIYGGEELIGYVVDDSSKRCTISVDADGYMTGMQISKQNATGDNLDNPEEQVFNVRDTLVRTMNNRSY